MSSASSSFSEAASSRDEGDDRASTDGEESPRKFRSVAHPALDRMIRVNQAGERAAVMIYAGQLAVLGKADDDGCIKVRRSQVGYKHDNIDNTYGRSMMTRLLSIGIELDPFCTAREEGSSKGHVWNWNAINL